jgi:copper chaperone CopZ
MTKQLFASLALAAGVVLAGVADAQQPAQQPWTAISIPDMHCAGCAKKVCGEIEKLPGVAKTQTDMKTKTVYALAQNGVVLSPRSLWEAVEKVDEVPAKLAGPSGTFTAKPK